MPLVWNQQLSVGIPEIDRQHRSLIGMIENLHRAMKEGRSRDVLLEVVDGLAAYALEHFATEERWFECYGFPHTEQHKQEHQRFIERVGEFTDKLATGKVGVGIELSLFLSNWLNTHVQEEDQQYARYFEEEGITSSLVAP